MVKKPKKEKSKTGLRLLSSLICKKVEERKTMSYNEVADELIREITNSPPPLQTHSSSPALLSSEKKEKEEGKKGGVEEKKEQVEVEVLLEGGNTSEQNKSKPNVTVAKQNEKGKGKKGKKAAEEKEVVGGEEKNIRRRIYDAVNVLKALKIIKKEKDQISWVGIPKRDSKGKLFKLEKEVESRKERVEKKKEKLADIELQAACYKALLKRNANMAFIEEEVPEKLTFPFLIISTPLHTNIDCSMTVDRRTFFFSFTQPFELFDDIEVLKKMNITGKPQNNQIPKQPTSTPTHFTSIKKENEQF